MNFKQIIAVIVMCVIGALIVQIVPTQWKYIFGFVTGTLVSLISHLLED